MYGSSPPPPPEADRTKAYRGSAQMMHAIPIIIQLNAPPKSDLFVSDQSSSWVTKVKVSTQASAKS